MAGLIALAIIAAAVLTKIWPALAVLVIPLAIALAAPRLRTQKRSPVEVTQYAFSEALSKLAGIGQQLKGVTDPDDVIALEADADALAVHCRALLRRPRTLRHGPPGAAAQGDAWPAVTADGSVIPDPDDQLTTGASSAPHEGHLATAPYDEAVTDLTDRHCAPTQTLLLPAD